MLPEGVHVKSVYLDAHTGILPALETSMPKILIDCSTIDTATSLHVKEQLAQSPSGSSFYDSPVSGGVLGAENGTIAFFLGASPTDPNVARLTPLLQGMGSKIIPTGGAGLGLAAKLSNNYLSGIITIACAEAMDMGMRAGIDKNVLVSTFGVNISLLNVLLLRHCPFGLRHGVPWIPRHPRLQPNIAITDSKT